MNATYYKTCILPQVYLNNNQKKYFKILIHGLTVIINKHVMLTYLLNILNT